jgi:hypothetical protein
MPPLSYPLGFVLVALVGWMNQGQRDVIEYLQEENRATGQPHESDWQQSHAVNRS